MGARGPNKLPAAIAKERGTYRPSSHPDEIAESGAITFIYKTIITPPWHMSAMGKKVWMAQLSEASRLDGYISILDLPLFESWCETYVDVMSLRKKKIRPFVKVKGVLKANPLHKVLVELEKHFAMLCSLFGFNPSARVRLGLKQGNGDESEDEYADFGR